MIHKTNEQVFVRNTMKKENNYNIEQIADTDFHARYHDRR